MDLNVLKVTPDEMKRFADNVSEGDHGNPTNQSLDLSEL